MDKIPKNIPKYILPSKMLDRIPEGMSYKVPNSLKIYQIKCQIIFQTIYQIKYEKIYQ
jgi:hypothetical protein